MLLAVKTNKKISEVPPAPLSTLTSIGLKEIYSGGKLAIDMNVKPPTVLTNLQRGNVKQENPMLLHQRSIYELAAQGELYNIETEALDLMDANKLTPLLWAASYGQSSTVELLTRLGANPNHRTDRGHTALMFAASKGFFHIIRTLIIGGADINDVDDVGNSALIYAAYHDHALVIHELLKNQADLSIVNIFGQTAYSITLSKRNNMARETIEMHLLSLLKEQVV